MKKFIPKAFLKNSSSTNKEQLRCQVCGTDIEQGTTCSQHATRDKLQRSDLASSSNVSNDKQFKTDSETEGKVAQLKAMFDNINEEAIRICLRDSDGNIERAIDTLLNLEALLPQSHNQTTSNGSPRKPSPSPSVPPTVIVTQNHDNSDRRPALAQENPYSPISAVKASLANEEKKDLPKKTDNVNNENLTIDQQLVRATTQGNIAMVQHFFKEVRPFVSRDIRSLLASCVNLCIERGNSELLSLFLDNGANPNGDADSVYTPLMLALEAKQLDCASVLLLKYKADPNKTNAKFSPLHLAVKYSYAPIVDLLVDKGANVNKVDEETGKTPLHYAVDIQDYEIGAKLLDFGADITAVETTLGETPLHVSTKGCKKTREIMLLGLLLEKTRQIPKALDIQDKYPSSTRNKLTFFKQGNTILHIATQRSSSPQSSSSLVNLVLGFNPNPTIRNVKGETPLDIVPKGSEKQKLIEQLSEYTSNWKRSHANSSSNDDDESALQDSRIKAPILPINAPSSEPDPDWLSVKNFKEHIEKMIASGQIEKEFEEIETTTADANLTEDFTSALQNYNLFKNRYRNILPYEKTRVKLQNSEGILGYDFVSANWVPGEVPGSERAFIATQGPLQHTVEDFWRMIWEHSVKVIVMLSNVVENGREKVWQYWPDTESDPLEIGDFKVSLMSAAKTDQLIHRHFSILDNKTNTTRIINHLQYIAWPDHGLPDTTTGFSQIINIVDSEATNNSPIAVHCSAGIGRTGVFCVAYSLLQKLRLLLWTSLPLTFDIKSSVYKLRDNRAGMIQTKEQYVFCYLSLVDRLSSVLEVLAYKNQRWFHKGIDSAKAQELLRGKPTGTWLVRYASGSEVQPNCIVISVCAPKGKVENLSCRVTEKGFTLTSSPDTTYPTLAKLLESSPATFKNPLYK